MAKLHQSQEVSDAVAAALSLGWRLIPTGRSSHAGLRLACPEATRDGCLHSVSSTPRNARDEADTILKKIKRCEHCGDPP